MTYDSRLAKSALTRRIPPPEPGTPEANPAATLIEPKVPRGTPRADDPRYWASVGYRGQHDGRRSPVPTALIPLPARTRVIRRVVGEVDRRAGGTVRGSEWNNGWRYKMGVASGLMLILAGASLATAVWGMIEFVW